MDINNLIERLTSLKYRGESEQVEYHVISSRNRALVSNEVRKWFNVSTDYLIYGTESR